MLEDVTPGLSIFIHLFLLIKSLGLSHEGYNPMSHLKDSDRKSLDIILTTLLFSLRTLAKRMFQLAYTKTSKNLEKINTSMHNLILMQKNNSLNKINRIRSNNPNREDPLLLQLIINITATILKHNVQFLRSLKFCINVDQITMRQL